MTHYTIRDAVTMRPSAVVDTIADVEDALEIERTAFLLNPPEGVDVLDLVVTADEQPDRTGDVVIHYAAGSMNDFSVDG